MVKCVTKKVGDMSITECSGLGVWSKCLDVCQVHLKSGGDCYEGITTLHPGWVHILEAWYDCKETKWYDHWVPASDVQSLSPLGVEHETTEHYAEMYNKCTPPRDNKNLPWNLH